MCSADGSRDRVTRGAHDPTERSELTQILLCLFTLHGCPEAVAVDPIPPV
jgi:hypothetical protein